MGRPVAWTDGDGPVPSKGRRKQNSLLKPSREAQRDEAGLFCLQVQGMNSQPQ